MSTVQIIINGCSQDIRRILDSGSTTDQVALIDYTNRIQLQLLREARWRFLLSGVLQFETVAGVTDYWIGATGQAPSTTYTLSACAPNPNGDNSTIYTGTALQTLQEGQEVVVSGFTNAVNNGSFIVEFSNSTTALLNNPDGISETHAATLQIQIPDTGLNITNLGVVKPGTVFDRTNGKRLYPTDEAPLGPNFQGNALPSNYRNDQNTPSIFAIYPPPKASGYVIEFRYFFAKPQLALLTDTLLIPDDYLDVVIAGVNWFANLYLRENYQDAQIWQTIYQQGITGMKRDHNLFPRGQEFIGQDMASQPRTVITPIGLDSGIETSIP